MESEDGLRKRAPVVSDSTAVEVPLADTAALPVPQQSPVHDPEPKKRARWAPSRTLRRSFVIAIWLLVLLVVAVLGFYFGWRYSSGGGGTGDLLFFNTTLTEARSCLGFGEQSTSDSVLVAYTVVSVDLVDFQLPLRVQATTCGGDIEDDDGLATVDITYTIDFDTIVLQRGLPAVQSENTQSLDGGPLYTYPFDVWTASITTNAFREGPNGTKLRIPVGVSVDAVSTAYIIRAQAVPNATDDASRGPLAGGLEIQIQISRTAVSIALVILIALSMWALSVSMLITALDAAYIRPHRVEADVVGASISLLFALPQLRDAMPAVPSLGFAQVDVFAYSVCLLISAVAAIILLWEFMMRTRVVDEVAEQSQFDESGGLEEGAAVIRHSTMARS
ncbi:hypothetical protein DFJ74DRAFT_681136 [Hyaloraphidium curvatum]|nr:hypothetical protein DFJ74DRAFT_681136 [Hyaloraphidium curvatum]